MKNEDKNIITLKLKYRAENIQRIQDYISNYNNVLRFTFNRIKENEKLSTKDTTKKQKALNNVFIDSHFKNSAIFNSKYILSTKNSEKLIFGGKKLFLQRLQNKISKDDFKRQKLLPLYSVGEASQKGNRKFQILSENQILFKPCKAEHFILDLENIGKNYKKHLLQLSNLASERKLPFDVKLSLDYVFISFDLNKLKKEKQLENQIQDRCLAIDLNPNYVRYSVIDWKSEQEYKIIDKGAFSLKDLNDYENLLKVESSNKKKLYCTNKRKYEIINISDKLSKLAIHFQCKNFVIEDLNIKNKDLDRGRKYNKLINNQWNRNLFVNQIKKKCKLYRIQLLEVKSQFSSFIGNLVYRKEKLPDFVLSSIEISRRGYEFNHQYLIKDKKIKKNIIQGNFLDNKRDYQQSLEELKIFDVILENFLEFYNKIKKSKMRYRFLLEDSKYAVFRKKHKRYSNVFYTFYILGGKTK